MRMPGLLATSSVSWTRSECFARLSTNIAVVAARNRLSPRTQAGNATRSLRKARRVSLAVPVSPVIAACSTASGLAGAASP